FCLTPLAPPPPPTLFPYTTLFRSAPRTILNRSITGSRRFAAQSWELNRLRGIAKSAGVTLNDAVLAMCSGALRAYLKEQGELPRSEEHTSELQSQSNLVCRLLLEK